MHCDDKRTKAVLKDNIVQSTLEMTELHKEHQREADGPRRDEIKKRIAELEEFISQNRDQLESMG